METPMDIHPNQEITNYYADTPFLPTDVPEVLITAEVSEEPLAETGREELVDTSVVGVPELREQTAPDAELVNPLPTVSAGEEHLDETPTQTPQPSLAHTAGEVAVSELVDELASQNGGEQLAESSESETASPNYFAEVTNDLGDESELEPNSEVEQGTQEGDSPEPLPGGGDDLDPPDDIPGDGTAEGDDEPDRAFEQPSDASIQAIWDMGEVLGNTQGEIGPFPAGERDDGTPMYDGDFPGARDFDFPSELVTEAGYPEGTRVGIIVIPPQVYNPTTDEYDQYDPSVHKTAQPDLDGLVQITFKWESQGVSYTANYGINEGPDGSLEANYFQRSFPVEGPLNERGIDVDQLSEQERADFIEASTNEMVDMQQESNLYGFSQADANRALRLIGLTLLREKRS